MFAPADPSEPEPRSHSLTTPDRSWADEAFRLLCDAGEALATSLDYESGLRQLAGLVVASVADLCLVDVIAHDGVMVRVAAAHRDPAVRDRVWELRGYPPDLDDPRDPIARVVRRGEPLLLRDVDPDWLDASAAEADQRDAWRSLGPRSLVAAPLATRGEILGAITLVSADPSRRFGGDDLALSVELARRAALTVDLARLHRSAQQTGEAAAKALGAMSHELRTPVHVVSMFADLLLMGVPVPVPEPARRHAEHIRTAAKHLDDLVTQVLTFSRLEAEGERLRTEAVDVGILARDTAALIEPLATQKDLRFRVDLPEEPVVARTDPHMLRQILFNLLGNAVKFTVSGEVGLTVWAGAEGATFEVRDTGIGIAPEHREKIFEPFWQADRESTAGAKGTGLGLGIVRRLAHLLGGRVDVESAPGAGTVFRVTLPLRREHD